MYIRYKVQIQDQCSTTCSYTYVHAHYQSNVHVFVFFLIAFVNTTEYPLFLAYLQYWIFAVADDFIFRHLHVYLVPIHVAAHS